ncbi:MULTISPECIES: cold-shock protein [unclassified Kitasatospora]|uniref:cold-shock protein n=1 Tax=unclassified Kitasatospora TaxID=2633591 RepID=UPI002E0D8AEF|nr:MULTISPECIES: cold-shock protein [unclassified Kitasatospora]
MPTGQVKWFNETKGFGFLSRDDGEDVFVHSKALPAGVSALKPGQRVEFGVVAGHRGDQAMGVTLLDALPSVAAAQRRSADDMAPIVQDLITMLDAALPGLQHGRYPAKPAGQKLAVVLRAVADQFDI